MGMDVQIKITEFIPQKYQCVVESYADDVIIVVRSDTPGRARVIGERIARMLVMKGSNETDQTTTFP